MSTSTFIAVAAMPACVRVYATGSLARPARSNEIETGLTMRSVENGDTVAIRLIGLGDMISCVAGTSIVADRDVYRSYDGTVANQGSSRIGRAITCASAGEIIQIHVDRR